MQKIGKKKLNEDMIIEEKSLNGKGAIARCNCKGVTVQCEKTGSSLESYHFMQKSRCHPRSEHPALGNGLFL